MKNLFLSLLCICGLFAYESVPLHYKSQTSIDTTFKIEFTNGIVFDACKCGCPKDAQEALATWTIGDAIEIVPYVADNKGQIYMLKNLNNGSEIFSWFKVQENADAEFVTLEHIEENKRVFETSDGNMWFTEDQEIEWEVGDRIFTHGDDLTILLINVDKPESGYVLAQVIESI